MPSRRGSFEPNDTTPKKTNRVRAHDHDATASTSAVEKNYDKIFYSCNPRNSRVKKKGILSCKEISGDKWKSVVIREIFFIRTSTQGLHIRHGGSSTRSKMRLWRTRRMFHPARQSQDSINHKYNRYIQKGLDKCLLLILFL